MRFIALLCVLLISLFPSPARAQTYSSTSSSLAYVYNGSAHVLEMQCEWLYSTSQSVSMQWATPGVSFDLTISKFESIEDYQNGNAYSVNLINFPCGSTEWSVGLYSPGTVRVYGLKTLYLDDGWYYALQMVPKAHFSYRSGYYDPWLPGVWPGQSQTLQVDKTGPGDDTP